MTKKYAEYVYDNVTFEISFCKKCGEIPFVNSMPHGEK